MQAQPFAPTSWGVIALVFSLVLGFIGAALGESFLSRLSLVLTIAALVLVIAGWGIFRLLIFPLTYLFLMVPPPYALVKQTSNLLKRFDAAAATEVLQIIGVPVHRDFYYLNLPNITLEIADVCSGIASLFAMIALGIVYIYFLPARYSVKVGLVAGLVGFPILANLFRIILIATSVYYYGPLMLESFLHQFTGTSTFLLSLGMLLSMGEWLRRRYPSRAQSNRPNQVESKWQKRGKPNEASISAPAVLASTVLAMGLYVSHAMSHSDMRRTPSDLEMPSELGPFVRISRYWADSYSDPYADKVFSRVYQKQGSQPIETYIGYRYSQSGTERLRSPRLVFPKGWEPVETNQIKIQVREKVHAAWMITKKNNLQRLVLFWYQLPDSAISSEMIFRWEIIRRWMVQSGTNAAVVRLATDLDSFEAVDAALKRLIAFSEQIAPYAQLLVQQAADSPAGF